MIRIYKLSSNPSSREAVAHLEAVGQEVEVRNMGVQPLTFEELKDILTYTENGTEDIVAMNGKVYKELVARGIDINELPLSKFYHYVKANPRLIKAPLIIGKGIMHVGYNADGIKEFYPRSMKLKAYMKKLEKLREDEDRRINAGEPIPVGYWGKDSEWTMTFSGSV
jgi:regulatory protein spx